MRIAFLILATLFSVSSYAAQTGVLGPQKIAVPTSKSSFSYMASFNGFFNGALGSLKVLNGLGNDIPTTPCTGTAKQINNCKDAREKALAASPTSFEVLLNGQVIVAKGSVPRTTGSVIKAIAVNTTNQITVNVYGKSGSYVTVSATSENVQPLQNPSADFIFTPTSGVIPLIVNFDASASSSPNGSIVSYAWDFGDGTSEVSNFQTSHIYNSVGAFSVVLTVTDSAGKTATKTSAVVVSPPLSPVPSFTLSIDSTTGALVVNADGSASTTPNGIILNYDWAWGDGSVNSSGVTSSHIYMAPGTYSVTLTIQDSSGFSASSSQSITIP